MKHRTRMPMLLLGALGVVGCSSDTDEAATHAQADTQSPAAEIASYAIGRNIAGTLIEEGLPVHEAMLLRGISDALRDAEPLFSNDRLAEALHAFEQESKAQLMQEEGAWNLEYSRAFFETNGKREGVVTTESGLQYEIIQSGDGPSPTEADTVVVHYRGVKTDGGEFDSSYRYGAPSVYAIQDVIDGWAEALALMNVGAQWRLYVPSHLAYGREGYGPVGPHEPVIFGIELLEIRTQAKPLNPAK